MSTIDEQSRIRDILNREWKMKSVGVESLQKWFTSLEEADKSDFREMFKTTTLYANASNFYDAQFTKGRAPVPFIQWAHVEARNAGAA